MTGSEMILWTVSLVIGILVTPGECVGISQSGVSVHLGHRDRKMNVQYFNDLRRDIGAADMNALTWDLSIAKEARRLGRSCDFSKHPDTEYPSALYKQLFDPTARPGEIIMNAIRFWASQKSNFTRFGWKSCEERNTCEYIKMITASAENAACSLTRCSHMRRQRQDEEANMYFVTCLFSPATDMAKPPFSKGRKCSRCPVYSGCRRGLCSSLGKRFSNKKKYPSPDKNRVVSLPGAKDVTPIKGSLIQGHRYLDAEGNIRIRTIPKYLAQTGRGPSFIYRPPRTRLHSQRPTRLNDRESQGRGAVRGVPAQGARGPMGSTDKFQLTQVHNTLRGTQLAELSWSNHLERWARYVIRCEIEYPGPIDTFTNFGKVDRTSRVYNIIYDWGAEGSDVNQRQNVGCRTPDDREKCNHNSIIRNPFIRNFACASLDCGSKTQLTCIYK
uniref:SCP domain-containing protein n=3 Tax=Magallana gigas TaxID=29159 RepID=A0A8W8MV43_MAGGI